MRTITPSTLQSYETHLQSEEKSPNTIAKYLRDLRTFTVWLAARETPDITKETVYQCVKNKIQNSVIIHEIRVTFSNKQKNHKYLGMKK